MQEQSLSLLPPSNKDKKLATLIMGFHPDYLAIQPHNFIIDGFERILSSNNSVEIAYHTGEPGSLRTDKNGDFVTFTHQEFCVSINQLMQFFDVEGVYENAGDGMELYNLLDNQNRNMNWVYDKIKEFRRKGFDIIKENKKEEALESEIGQTALKEYHKLIKDTTKEIRVETFGGQHRSTCHYMKYVLKGETDDISIRFFYQFGDREEYEGKFVMKDHRTKNYIVLHTPIALHMLSTLVLQDQYRVISFPDMNKYIKLVVRGYFKDGVRIPKGEREVSLDSEKNTGTGSSPKMLKRVRQKERDAKAPEELEIAKLEIKKLKKDLKELQNQIDDKPVTMDFIKAYHAQLKRKNDVSIDIQEIDNLSDNFLALKHKNRLSLEKMREDFPVDTKCIHSEDEKFIKALHHPGCIMLDGGSLINIEDVDVLDDKEDFDQIDPKTQEMLNILCADKAPEAPEARDMTPRWYQTLENKEGINEFIYANLVDITNEVTAEDIILQTFNVKITFSEIRDILARGPKDL